MFDSLPLTPIEELMLHQDTRSYPYTCFIRLRFAGRCQRSAFESAARRATVRHPMLTARVVNHRRPRWQISADVPVEIVWREGAVTDCFPTARFLELSTGGLRLLVTRGEDASDLLVQFHHACCDGLGIFQFIHDLLILYALETGVSSGGGTLPDLDARRLAGRGTYGLSWSKLVKMAPRQAVGLAGVRQFLMRRPSPIVPHQRQPSDAATSDPYPAACAHHFDAGTSAAFRQQAKALRVTTNDLLTRDLLVAIREFRVQRGITDDAQWLRLLVPVSLRRAADRRLPAANVVSSVFIDRQGAAIDDAEQLLASISDEMQLIKSHQLGFTFVFSLHVNRWTPGGLRRAARSSRCHASAVFTNLGRTLSRSPLPREDGDLICGDVRLENVEILAPLTPFTCAAFAAGWYGERLSITLHYDPRPLTADDARELLGLFVGKIQQSAGCRAVSLVV